MKPLNDNPGATATVEAAHDTTPAKKQKGRPRLPVEKLRVRLPIRVTQTTRDLLLQWPDPGRHLERVVAGASHRGKLLTRALPFLDQKAAEGDCDALQLADEIRREMC